MRKITFTLKHFVFILFTACSLSSCFMSEKSLQASMDRSSISYGGDSFDEDDPDALGDFGANLAFMVGVAGSRGMDLTKNKSGAYRIHNNNPADVLSLAAFSSHQKPFTLQNTTGFTGDAVQERTSSFMDNTSILTGLEFIQRKSKDGNEKIGLNYLKIPVLGIYNCRVTNGGKVFGGLGPYFAYGIGGKIKGNGYSLGSFDKESGFKRFDAGLALTGGYRFPMGLTLRLGYDLGLVDIDRIEVDHAKNRTVSLNIAYDISSVFGNKK